MTVFMLLAACTPDAEGQKEEPVLDRKIIVARVNGEPVYKSDVVRRARAAYGSDIEGMKADQNRWQMIMDVATETELMDKLLLQSAVAEGLTLSSEQAQKLLERTRAMAGDRAFKEMLWEHGSSEKAFQDFLVKQELISQYKNRLFGETGIDEDTLRDYYEGHRETFVKPAQVRLEVFTFGARETAMQVYSHWKNGENFDTIAGKYLSEGENIARRTRWMPIEAVPAQLQARVANGSAGSILEPAQISGRFYVVRIAEKMAARTQGFEEVKEEITGTILNLRKNKALDEWYKTASQEARIEYVEQPHSQ